MQLNSTQPGRKMHPIARERKRQEMSVRELASKAGLSYVGLSHLETGRSEPRLKTQRAIAGALGVRIRDLWPEPPELRRNGHKRP
jgi:transcriptional regulator with XRE-family HTH domain